MNGARVIGLARSGSHRFSKEPCERLTLIAGYGVADDAHAGATVQHVSRKKKDPHQPNLRQVHLIHSELLDEVAAKGFAIASGELGENLTTRGIDLLALPTDARLRIGDVVVRVTGLRNPCWQIDAFRPGLLAEMIEKRADGSILRKCGVMAVVESGGEIAQGAAIEVELPPAPHRPLDLV
ncbi:MOSC domain-containing protein [Tsuneonella deserti]|uniref:MOSC domain-containing protein n=1 Tax=Tsuneonella deserti TaxID=2035528 RepID=A0ABQ1S3U5_9SPHN|nr:MOSC domain-containing protein [Tsuneonella deserti]GGD89476.1 MOSC domain-containing protein [Tsuneonella deserti]